jgi:hypothetical protein
MTRHGSSVGRPNPYPYKMSLRDSHVSSQSPFISGTASVAPPTLSLPEGAAGVAKPKKNRCAAPNCSRRLALTDFDCRCGARHCAEHRVPEAHACTFDFRAAARSTLATQLNRVVGDKLERC